VVLVTACTDVQAPRRAERYEWRLEGTTSFHWPREALPVRVWVEDSENLPAYAAAAIEDWKSAFLYGELDARLVADSNEADVLVRNTSPPATPSFSARLFRRAPECQGATDLAIDGELLQLPVRVYIDQRLAGEGLAACYRLTLRHELGHAFGIWNHSPDEADAMFGNPVLDGLSDADRQTMEYLYHFPSNVAPAR
jgi:predicted Zn-dependent protease